MSYSVNKETSFKDRFEPMSITPKGLVDMLDCDNDSIKGVKVGDRLYKLTDRFYKSLAARLGVPFGVFGLFSPHEVMDRAAERQPSLDLRMTVDTKDGKVLGLTENKGLPVPVNYIDHVLREDKRTRTVEYSNGEIVANLALDEWWSVPKDSDYQLRVQCTVPVDGLSQPDMKLSMLRQVCTNGAVAEGRLFTTKMILKDNSGAHFQRLLESFSNPDGVEALQDRIQAAASTKASVGEVLALEGMISRSVPDPKNQLLLRERLYEIADNPCVRYGVTDLTTIGLKKRSLLPVGCSVADLLNFASELGTHHREIVKEPRYIQSFFGTIMSHGCDLADLYPNAQKTAAYYLENIEFEGALR